MEARAVHNFARQSPRKVRAVANMIRGRRVDEALAILRLQPRRAARLLAKVLGSAVSNAAHNQRLDPDQLVIEIVAVDAGPTVKRWMPRAMGRANRILKRSSHIEIVVRDRVSETAR